MNTSTTRYLEFHAAAYYSNLPTCEDYWIFIDNANKITHIWNSDDEMLKWVDEWMYGDPQFGGTIIGKNNSIYCLTRKWHITPERIEFINQSSERRRSRDSILKKTESLSFERPSFIILSPRNRTRQSHQCLLQTER